MLQPYEDSFKSQLHRLRLDCDHFTESEEDISDRVDQGLINLVTFSREICNMELYRPSDLSDLVISIRFLDIFIFGKT